MLDEQAFSTYDIGHLEVEPLLFQTGYLTIKDYDESTGLYCLYYPNYEVENAFLKSLLYSYSALSPAATGGRLWQLIKALQAQDLDTFFSVLSVFFAEIPYDIQIRQEKYFQTIFYLIFKLIGLQIGAEVRANQGRIDAVIELEHSVYIFEFKLHGTAAEALQQINDRDYAARYRLEDKELVMVGVQFDIQQRKVIDWRIR